MKPARMMAALLLALCAPYAWAQQAQCPPPKRPPVYLSMDPAAADPQREIAHRIATGVHVFNQTVLLRSDVIANFSDFGDGQGPLLPFARCVTLGSFSMEQGRVVVPGRSPRRAGPQLVFGSNPARSEDGIAFLDITCSVDEDGERARITGVRIEGPSRGDQSGRDTGIAIHECHDVEISNSEIAGWGNAAIDMTDQKQELNPQTGVPVSEPKEILLSIHGNYIHGNQHSSQDHHAAGYGVSVGKGAFARIYQNAFDDNRHSITSSGDAGGYRAAQNLILKGGGYHGSFFERDIQIVDAHGQTGWFSLPGSASDYFWGALLVGLAFGALFGPLGALIGLGAGALIGLLLWLVLVPANNSSYISGYAGLNFDMQGNTFQYKKTLDIKVRGTPAGIATIDNNIFVRSDPNAAINPTDNDSVKIGPKNLYNVETFGTFQVCDFDGDGVDDLFLATGVSWWYSSMGRGPWTFLRADTSPPKNLKVGYFDADNRCDVITQREPDEWVISSGGTTDWLPLGGPNRHLHFGHPVSDVQFGRFDPTDRDHRPGVTKRTTHAFWRRADGQWFVTALTAPNWHPVASSSFPMAKLRFGDFNGDGVTDVLANEGGHWAVSDSAIGAWRTLHPVLNDPVENLYIGNMDRDDNIDDLLKLDTSWRVVGASIFSRGTMVFHFKWWRSRNGTDNWQVWREYDMSMPLDTPDYVVPGIAFAGRFGEEHGGATLLVDSARYGHFFGRGSSKIPQPVDWLSPNAY